MSSYINLRTIIIFGLLVLLDLFTTKPAPVFKYLTAPIRWAGFETHETTLSWITLGLYYGLAWLGSLAWLMGPNRALQFLGAKLSSWIPDSTSFELQEKLSVQDSANTSTDTTSSKPTNIGGSMNGGAQQTRIYS